MDADNEHAVFGRIVVEWEHERYQGLTWVTPRDVLFVCRYAVAHVAGGRGPRHEEDAARVCDRLLDAYVAAGHRVAGPPDEPAYDRSALQRVARTLAQQGGTD